MLALCRSRRDCALCVIVLFSTAHSADILLSLDHEPLLSIMPFVNKALLAVFAFSLFYAPTTTAQPGQRGAGDPAERLQRQLDQIQEAVGLSDVKIEQLRPIIEDQQAQRRELFEQFGRSEALRAAMTAVTEETEAEIAEILTEEEMTRYREWQETPRRNNPRNRMRPQGGGN